MATVPATASYSGTGGGRKVMFACSLGTVFAWYDFYLYGALATILAKQFFAGADARSGFIFAALTFAAGFIVRPFGALLFGWLGDRIGRKYTLVITLLIMGASTFLIGLLPSHASIGIAAPVILVVLRILQGLALGGEYGAAAIYVAEHAPGRKRGAYTAWTQAGVSLGLALSLLVILGTRGMTGEENFTAWGWRIPFLLSVFLVAMSVWMRLWMQESPAFEKMRAEGGMSAAPLAESFGQWHHLKAMIVALFGPIAGQTAIWYASQVYALVFLTQTLKVDMSTATLLVAASMAAGIPFFVGFGMLSDRMGRKKIIVSGCLLAALTYFPIFDGLTYFANPALDAARRSTPVVLHADPEQCSPPFSLDLPERSVTSCGIAKQVLSALSVGYATVALPAGSVASVRIGDSVIPSFHPEPRPDDLRFSSAIQTREQEFTAAVTDAVRAAGYPVNADPDRINKPMVLLLLTLLALYVGMVHGPMAAMLVEMFPTRIRSTAMSLPYHIGNGWIGTLLPAIAFVLAGRQGDLHFGLWYPVGMALTSMVICLLFIREPRHAVIDGPGP
jgi:MFS family permease